MPQLPIFKRGQKWLENNHLASFDLNPWHCRIGIIQLNSIKDNYIADESYSEDSDDFLDEYGNIREESSDSSNVSEGEEETVEAVGGQRPERGPRVKKKKNKKKKKVQSSASVSGASNQATNHLRWVYVFLKLDRVLI